MKSKHASLTSLGAAPWKFLLLAATLLFTYALPVHADDHEEAPAPKHLLTKPKLQMTLLLMGEIMMFSPQAKALPCSRSVICGY